MTDRDRTIGPPGSPTGRPPGRPPGSPLRRRMTFLRPPKRASRRRVEDMTVRGFTASTQRGYIRAAVREFHGLFQPPAGPGEGRAPAALPAAHEIERGLNRCGCTDDPVPRSAVGHAADVIR